MNNLAKELKKCIKKYNVPGASIAVLKGKRIIASEAAGVINLNTGVPTTNDTLFQIGSITKLFTATIIMQLRDEKRLSLDDRLLDYLPDFMNSNMQRLDRVTIRHLLKHQSGIDGDFFPQVEYGNQSIEDLLKMSSMLPSLFEPGTNFSYCNIGFSILGRIIEVLDNRTYDESIKERIFVPLEMKHALSRPEDNLRFRAAIGHIPDASNHSKLIVPEYPYIHKGHKAAGSTPAMTATDLLKFSAAHLFNGKSLKGFKLLSKSSSREMLKPQLRPKKLSNIGLAWFVETWDGKKVFHHSGSTLGQSAFLIACPQSNLSIATLMNGGDSKGFYQEVISNILQASVKISLPASAKPKEGIKYVSQHLIGRYTNMNIAIEVKEEKGILIMMIDYLNDKMPTKKVVMKFSSPQIAVTSEGIFKFCGPKNEPAKWVQTNLRLLNRV